LNSLTKVGFILKPQGIRGEIKVRPTAQAIQNFVKFTDLIIGGISYPVKNIALRQGYLYISLKGIDDRNAAELLRNKEIFADIKEEPLTKGAYYIKDLIGCEVFKSGNLLGSISDVLSHGAADVIVITGKKEIMFPHIKGIFRTVNLLTKRIDVDTKLFEQVTSE